MNTRPSLFTPEDFASPPPDPAIRAFFSKSATARLRFVQERLPADRTVLHLHPKNLPRVHLPGNVVAVTYEDITKTDVWLRVNNLIDDRTFLVLENPSRYPKITSEKVKFLRRLSMRLRGDRLLTDIVPFTESIEYLYTPYSYLGREILGYPHWYAFRENYQEIDAQGRVVNAHDMDVLAGKAAPVSQIDYCGFLAPCRETIRFAETEEETARYDAKRGRLFAQAEADTSGRASFSKMVTRLADLTHSFASRQQTLLALASRLTGDTILFCNLLDYAKTAERALKAAGLTHCRAASYQRGAEGLDQVRNCIYLESPIVHSFYFLDIEAALPSDCRVFHLLGEQKVDHYLYGQIQHESGQIDQFTRALWKATRMPQKLPGNPA